MNDEVDDPKWEEKLIKKLQDYNKRYCLFKDTDNTKKKVKYVIEDTHNIRFFEFADDMIQKDVFNQDIIDVLPPKKRGRPRKYPLSNDPPKAKLKPGRPIKYIVDVKEGEIRKHKVCEKYLNQRYKTDDKFRENLKQKRRERYLRQKTNSNNSDDTISEGKNI